MARRILNRRQLRAEADEAARTAPAPPPPVVEEEPSPAKPRATRKPAAARAPRKPRAKKEPPRLRARWGVFDGAMKQVAVFDYNKRAAAEVKLAELNAKKPGQYFLQIVKEPMIPLPA